MKGPDAEPYSGTGEKDKLVGDPDPIPNPNPNRSSPIPHVSIV